MDMHAHTGHEGHDAPQGAPANAALKDPVCGMSVEAVKAVTAEHNGNVYYFCSRGCSWEFGTDPGRFAGAVDERRN